MMKQKKQENSKNRNKVTTTENTTGQLHYTLACANTLLTLLSDTRPNCLILFQHNVSIQTELSPLNIIFITLANIQTYLFLLAYITALPFTRRWDRFHQNLATLNRMKQVQIVNTWMVIPQNLQTLTAPVIHLWHS